MAAAVAAPVNGLSGDAAASEANATAAANSSSSVTSSGKRKRDPSDSGDETMTDVATGADGDASEAAASAAEDRKPTPDSSASPANGDSKGRASPAPITTSTTGNRDEKRLIRDYFEVLTSFDKSSPPLLKRPLPETSASEEPQAKRQKSGKMATTATAVSIADKVVRDAYALLDDLVEDVATIVSTQLAALESTSAKTEADTKEVGGKDVPDAAKESAIAQITRFRQKAHELYRRETAYPKSGPLYGRNAASGLANGDAPSAPEGKGDAVLTVFGNTPQPRQLFSSLPHRASKKRDIGQADDEDKSSIEEIVREDGDLDLPNISVTRVFPVPPAEKPSRVLTFGELFPSPRNLPALQPPKAPKSTTKSTTLGFYHPELMENHKYRSGSYFSQHITGGQWLDYSNATPSLGIKTKQRERAQSLAGHKPSSSELELSEMEALFRGAFSSFAPSKDDSGALVPAAQLGGIWWQRVGYRVFQRIVENELAVEDGDEENETADSAAETADALVNSAGGLALDEEALQKTIEEWDDSLVDPTLEQVMGGKADAEKDVDEVLQDVSDMIITLSSYQRNRNLTLPTSQDRFSADPVNADMLRNGTLAQQPSEEETLTYQTLKAQLALIIQGLPPYAVARLNSDKLAELNISTKIEVRSEEYHGVMEEDEAVLRARQAAQAQAAVSSPQQRPAGHRAPSVSGHGYGQQFGTPSRSPMPVNSGYYQTPGRAQPHRQSVGGATPGALPHVRGAAQAPQQYRPSPNGYGNFMPALGKAQAAPYRGQPQGVPLYPGQPGVAHMSPQRAVSQPQPQPQPGAYGSPAVQAGAPPQFRYAPGAAGYPQQPPPQQVALPPGSQTGMAQQPRLPQQVPYTPSPANGASHLGQQQRPLQAPHAASPQLRAQVPYQTPGQVLLQQQQQQLAGRGPYAGLTPQQMQGAAPNAGPQQQQQQRYLGAGSPNVGVPGAGGVAATNANLGPFGYHTVMDQPQQQRLMEQARARASAHERSLGFGDKISQGSVGQIAGLTGIGLGSGGGGGGGSSNVDAAKLNAARANMPGMSPMAQRPGVPAQYPQGVPSAAMNGSLQHMQSPSPMPSSVSPAPSGGFQRPP